MRRLYLILLVCWAMLPVASAQQVQFQFQDSLNNKQLQTKVEQSLSLLLTEINAAYKEHRPLQLANDYITDEACESLCNLWDKYAHFECEDNVIITKQLPTSQGFLVREIFITLHPNDTSDSINVSRELLIALSPKGDIVDACLAMEGQAPQTSSTDAIFKRAENDALLLLSKYVQYFYIKDIKMLTSFYSDDFMTVCPKWEFTKTEGNHNNDIVIVNGSRYSARDYFGYDSFGKSVNNLLKRKGSVKVEITGLILKRHPARADFYSLTFHQTIRIGNRTCGGTVFMLVQCKYIQRDNSRITVWARTWQPDTPDGKPVPEDERFNESDFPHPVLFGR